MVTVFCAVSIGYTWNQEEHTYTITAIYGNRHVSQTDLPDGITVGTTLPAPEMAARFFAAGWDAIEYDRSIILGFGAGFCRYKDI